MIGPDGSRGAMPLFAGMVGARDLGLGLGLVLALQRRGSVREWLEASALVDSLDVAAALLAREHLRTGAAPGVAVLAASGALLSAWLSRQLDEASPATAAVHAASEGPRTLVVERHAPGGRAGTSA